MIQFQISEPEYSVENEYLGFIYYHLSAAVFVENSLRKVLLVLFMLTTDVNLQNISYISLHSLRTLHERYIDVAGAIHNKHTNANTIF